ncbi:MAG: RNA 2',3'-cyclic phosphodiesterase [Bryobacteraceae bacterium]|nr:RNA 2',3'-cyclic phosphodiesterase [Bryobacteraceae bacterium]
MRLFTGIALPEEIEGRLEQLLGRLRPAAPAQSWSPAANLHVTIKFIGELPEARLEELKQALAALPARAPEVELKGLGWFPNPHRPRVLWAGVQAGPALSDLAAAANQGLVPLGIAAETKPYSPHLTLARIKSDEGLIALRQAIAQLDSVEFGRFRPDSFHLYLSKPGPRGSVYSKLASFPLA